MEPSWARVDGVMRPRTIARLKPVDDRVEPVDPLTRRHRGGVSRALRSAAV